MVSYTIGMLVISLVVMAAFIAAIYAHKGALTLVTGGSVLVLGALWLQQASSNAWIDHLLMVAEDEAYIGRPAGWGTLPSWAYDMPVYVGVALVAIGLIIMAIHALRKKRT